MNSLSRIASLWIIVISPVLLAAQEWPRFRGPNGAGHGNADVPLRWTAEDYNWSVTIPGTGHSSPVLWGNRLFLTSGDADSGKRIAVCIDADTGRTLWKQEEEGGSYKKHNRNSFATSTPAVDAERLYLAWATPNQLVVEALDHDGKQVWKTPLGPFKGGHGFGVSPIVVEGMVILPNDQDGGGSLLGLDAQTGKVVWKVARKSGNATYSTPCVFKPADGSALVIFTNWQHGVTAVEPGTGKVAWDLSVFSVDEKERAIASPVVAGELILGTCGFVTKQKHLVAIHPGDPRQGVKPREVWRYEKAVSYMPTPLVRGEHIYLCSEKGIASCLEAATGKVIWEERLDGSFSASPVCAGDRLYCVSDSGDVFVLQASPAYKLLGRNRLGEPTQATPAIAQGRLYLRTETKLISIGGKK